jgi:fido (protein-threonine AMPylation protein)
MATDDYLSAIIDFVAKGQRAGSTGVPPRAIEVHMGRSRPTVNRALLELTLAGRLERLGAGRSTVYRVPLATVATVVAAHEPQPEIPRSAAAKALLARLSKPLGARRPVSYQRSFVDGYKPNKTTLMPARLAAQLVAAGKSKDQLPAGTYARKVLEQLLIDLSWFSSRLEGNRTSLLATRDLFEKGRSENDDRDATMLLNHKEAIEFMVDAVPTEGITVPVVRNLQSLLMQGLLADPADLGAIRRKIVNIQDTVYVPSQVPSLLENMLGHIVEKARNTRNPVEASFFLWVNIAYLQPFVDGNKRTSRLAANMPLMLANCAPLSFLDVGPHDYAMAMLGVYERLDVTLAVELFAWTYRRSIEKYQVVVESMGHPDPLRVRYREQLGEAVRQVVYFGRKVGHAVKGLAIPAADAALFDAMLQSELTHLEPYNCARYRLPIGKTQEWIDKGRPH